jgi:hypothetical protein
MRELHMSVLRFSAPVLALAALLLAGCASSARPQLDPGPGALRDAGPVAVSWDDPERFAERLRDPARRDLTSPSGWVGQLAAHLRAQVEARLAPGERVEVRITDMARAGAYESFAVDARDIRILRDIHPPLIDLEFRHFDAQGGLLREARRRLRDPGYLMSASPRRSDPLRFEKALIDTWAAREFRRD